MVRMTDDRRNDIYHFIHTNEMSDRTRLIYQKGFWAYNGG